MKTAFCLILFFLNAALGCGEADAGWSQRIIGGHETSTKKYPWFAALVLAKSKSYDGYVVACGGTLINSQHLLTAAHCFMQFPKRIWTKVYLAAFGLENQCQKIAKDLLSISKVAIHGRYSRNGLQNDIGLITLAKSVDYRPVCLPTPSTKLKGNATIIGFGNLRARSSPSYPCKLQEAEVKIFTRNQCLRTGIALLIMPLPKILCAGKEKGGVDTCDGDSGGPLLRTDRNGKFYIEGITSFGIRCAQPNKPGVYTDVAKYTKWISGNSLVKPGRRFSSTRTALRSNNSTDDVLPDPETVLQEELLYGEEAIVEEETSQKTNVTQ